MARGALGHALPVQGALPPVGGNGVPPLRSPGTFAPSFSAPERPFSRSAPSASPLDLSPSACDAALTGRQNPKRIGVAWGGSSKPLSGTRTQRPVEIWEGGQRQRRGVFSHGGLG